MKSTAAVARICAAVLLLASGCGPELDENGQPLTTRLGVDYSWYRPSPASLVSQGYTFAVRYLSHDTTGKNLSKSEADALIAAGLDVVCNWEDSAQNALSGYNQGVSDAQAANTQAAADGAPSTRPIYFSVDFDATQAQQTPINSYFDGVASVIGKGRTGAYGGYYVVERLFNAGKITFGWQTYAWSGGQWESRAQLRQTQNGIAGGEMDEDEAVAADFGQWGGADYAGESLGVSGQSYPIVSAGEVNVAVGQTVTGWVKLKNIGNATWKKGVVKLAPIPRDQATEYQAASWLAANRISTVSADVAPGATGQFELDIEGHKVGTAILSLGWVAEGITWFADAPKGGGPPDGYFEVKVNVVPAPAGPDASVPVHPDASVPVVHPDASTPTEPEDASAPVEGEDAAAPVVEPDGSVPAAADAGQISGEEDAAASTAADGGTAIESDGSTEPAAHHDGGEDAPVDAGCGCGTSASAPAPLLALMALALVSRRRRQG